MVLSPYIFSSNNNDVGWLWELVGIFWLQSKATGSAFNYLWKEDHLYLWETEF